MEISGGGVGLWQGVFPYISYLYKDIQIEMFEYEIEYDFVHSGTRFRFSFFHIRQIDRLAGLFLIFKQRKKLKTENP